ncbi:hypothetical protein SELMODRAFT_411322 [Selaginella moellendorffii]|uniref:Phosphoribosyl-AMP cyclohydrolase domain-containing protein n=2 Tax=Selaginella moellendorffii TaxID=88036 RepID=D8RH99_SELML|nr:histidine biosynthesis bifunctional protein hisIE, chloroplastic [Selaginella moellendorffii]EFJ28492.1 hypothetical protein SELMODRAFT_411322 [Selaginella moellendorffii]|eukprot:XP_002970362.1 histidine biosynthesis bifunctional protein hisIE, chloroplastic [Selaginella moellendorffii]
MQQQCGKEMPAISRNPGFSRRFPPAQVCLSRRFSGAASRAATRALARSEPVSTVEVEALLDLIKWDSSGLAVAIAQDVDTGAILMQGFVNRDAVSATIASKRATYFSRSRRSLWTKGETSSNFIDVVDVYLDCDRDSIIYLGKPDGPTCHTGADTCYFTRAADILQNKPLIGENGLATSTLYDLERVIQQRKSEPDGKKPSWTKRLLQDQKLLCSKIREEAGELCKTVEENEGRKRTVSEMADVLYHSMVLLAAQDVKMAEVMEVLRARFSQSGIEEKSSRGRSSS